MARASNASIVCSHAWALVGTGSKRSSSPFPPNAVGWAVLRRRRLTLCSAGDAHRRCAQWTLFYERRTRIYFTEFVRRRRASRRPLARGALGGIGPKRGEVPGHQTVWQRVLRRFWPLSPRHLPRHACITLPLHVHREPRPPREREQCGQLTRSTPASPRSSQPIQSMQPHPFALPPSKVLRSTRCRSPVSTSRSTLLSFAAVCAATSP